MIKCPKFDEWNFPQYLIGVCKTNYKFDEAEKILINKYGFVPSPIEEGRSDRALVLPIPEINLEERFKSKNYDIIGFDWGIGRARIDREHCEHRGGPSFEFRYLEDCSWEYICTNPMKKATIDIISILKPNKFLDFRGAKIQNPYKISAD